MSERGRRPDANKDQGSPTLFYVIVGVVVLLFLIVLVLKPHGAAAQAPTYSAARS